MIPARMTRAFARTAPIFIALTLVAVCHADGPSRLRPLARAERAAASEARNRADILRGDFQSTYTWRRDAVLSPASPEAAEASRNVVAAFESVMKTYPGTEVDGYAALRLAGFYRYTRRLDAAEQVLLAAHSRFEGTSTGNEIAFNLGLFYAQATNEPAEAEKWFLAVHRAAPESPRSEKDQALHIGSQQHLMALERQQGNVDASEATAQAGAPAPDIATQRTRSPAQIAIDSCYRDLIAEYLAWRPDHADQENPLRRKILDGGPAAVPYLLEISAGGEPSPMPLAVVWLLGEIGSWRAFPALIREYQRHPNPRVAISLGACLNRLLLDDLVAAFPLADEASDELMRAILGAGSADYLALPAQERRKYLDEHVDAIRDDCRRRSVPALG